MLRRVSAIVASFIASTPLSCGAILDIPDVPIPASNDSGPNSNGSSSSSSSGGSPSGEGGSSSSSGSGPSDGSSSGSSSGSGGSSGSTSSSSSGGDSGSDGGSDASLPCDYNGTWGSKLTLEVNWMPQGLTSIILASGTGHIEEWIKGVRVQQGNRVTDTTVVCGIQLPDFQSTSLATSETYGVVFPPTLFDGNYLPPFTVSGTISGQMPGATYAATASAALLGISLTNPTTDAWPSTVTTAVDTDQDGKPGITANVATGISPTGPMYSGVPVGIPAPFQPTVRASRLYLAIRQVTVASGTAQDCAHINGTVTIPTISGKPGIDSHVIGCALAAGGDCSSSQANFVDNTQSVFTPTGTSSFQSIRLPTGSTCAALRQMLP